MTLAHEVGHACKRQDIYVTGGSLSIVGEAVEQSKMPMDWTNGYHPPGITQDEIVKRLLMYGKSEEGTGTRIPRGNIYGVGYTPIGHPLAPVYLWDKGLRKVGLEGMRYAPFDSL